MKLVVVGMAPKNGNCWTRLFETLDQGVEEGVVSYTVIDYFDAIDDTIKQYDGAIYLENAPITEDIPFMALDECNFTDEEFFEFIDVVNEYIHYRDNQEFVDVESNQAPIVEDAPKSKKATKKKEPINLDELCVEITEDDIKKLVIKAVTVTVGNKEIEISTRDFIALSKMYKIMDRFGYKVKNVIV